MDIASSGAKTPLTEHDDELGRFGHARHTMFLGRRPPQ
jgi:hypothetical protein